MTYDYRLIQKAAEILLLYSTTYERALLTADTQKASTKNSVMCDERWRIYGERKRVKNGNKAAEFVLKFYLRNKRIQVLAAPSELRVPKSSDHM